MAAILLSCMVSELRGQDVIEPDGSENVLLTNKQLRKQRPTYINVGLGPSYFRFRDFATSPLFYEGFGIQGFISRLKMDSLRESEAGIDFGFGKCRTNDSKDSEFANVWKADVFYSRLYKINQLSPFGCNIKGGFLVDATGDLRQNEQLMNNGLGLEFTGNIMGSAKVTKGLGRNYFKKKQESKKRSEVSFQLNIGLINCSYRNGYIYSDQGSIVNDIKLAEDYDFSIFSGFRMSSKLDFTRYMNNKNAFQVSYVWDAFKTGGDFEKFEMAQHTLRFTLLFNTNNR